jgi:hypothetical protein
MKVNELIAQLSTFSVDSEVEIAGIFNADLTPRGEDWSEYENLREVESGDIEIYTDSQDKRKVVIQFYTESPIGKVMQHHGLAQGVCICV